MHDSQVPDDKIHEKLFFGCVISLHKRPHTSSVLRPRVTNDYRSSIVLVHPIGWVNNFADGAVGAGYTTALLEIVLFPPTARESDGNLCRAVIRERADSCLQIPWKKATRGVNVAQASKWQRRNDMVKFPRLFVPRNRDFDCMVGFFRLYG